MLTTEESIRFIRDKLGILDPEIQMKGNKLEFLNLLVSAMHSIPFQSVTLMSNALQDRRRPTREEVKTTMLEGKGGLCYAFNLFTYYFLKSLGYEVYLNSCQCPHRGSIYNNHLLVLVYNLKKDGSIHMVDTGCASPTFSAIALDFQNETPIFNESFLRYKFTKTGNKIQRFHDRSGFELSPGKPSTKEFELFYEFEINPTTSLDGINSYFDDIYTIPDLSTFHRSVRAIKFVNKKVIVLCNYKLVLETDSGEFPVTVLSSNYELEAAYQAYFPELDATIVKKAIEIWRNDAI